MELPKSFSERPAGPPEDSASDEEVPEGEQMVRKRSLGSEYRRFKQLTRSCDVLPSIVAETSRSKVRRASEPYQTRGALPSITSGDLPPRTMSCDLPALGAPQRRKPRRKPMVREWFNSEPAPAPQVQRSAGSRDTVAPTEAARSEAASSESGSFGASSGSIGKLSEAVGSDEDSSSVASENCLSEMTEMTIEEEKEEEEVDGDSEDSSSVASENCLSEMTEMTVEEEEAEAEDSDSEDDFSPEILRGVPLSYTLKGAGELWKTSPIDRDPAELQEIHSASRECSSLDAFISQTWQTPGWQRYLALLVQYYWRRAAAVGLSANALLFLLDAAGRLPTFRFAQRALALPADVKLSPWSPIPVALSLATLFLGPSLPWRKDPSVFFDAVCINQTDSKAKAKGVYSLNEFLKMSSELVVLWTPEYLQRMWCVYELAFFAARKDISKITIIPVAQRKLHFFLFCATGLLSCLPGAARSLSPLGLRGVGANFWLRLGSLLLVRLSLPYAKEVRRLGEQFDSFDIRQAQCREEFDRRFVTEGIIQQYGDEDSFNRYVQGPLKSKVMAALPPLGMNYKQLLGAMASFSVVLASQGVASLARARVGRAGLARLSLTWLVHLGVVYPMCFKLHFMAASAIARRCRRGGSEWACSVAVAMLLSKAFGLAQGAMVWAQGKPSRACVYVPAALLAARALFKHMGDVGTSSEEPR